MTTDAVRAGTPRAIPIPYGALAGVTAAAGCLALLARPVSGAFIPITVSVALAGALHPVATGDEERSGRVVWATAVALGIAAFGLARGLLAGSVLPPMAPWLAGSVIVAAVAEEAFFRRFLYAALLRWGAPLAMAVSSAAFAIVHVTLWGWRAVPVDLAAGALLGWQRWATGSWTAPAVTHAAANLLMLL